jgi:hypothetical protein
MENLTIIIPVNAIDTDEKKDMLNNAIKSVRNVDTSEIIIVGSETAVTEAQNAINSTSDITLDNITFIINDSNHTNYAGNVNFAVKNVDTKYFSVLEFDDTFNKIWFSNLEKYIKEDTLDTFAFLPLTEIIDFNSKQIFGYANEAVWASAFSDEIGCFDFQSMEDYLNFNASGGAFKTEDFLLLGGLKTSLELVTWYEFFLRVLYKQKRVFVIPKVGYFHVVNRPDSITDNYIKNMTEKEADWWIELAKKEYFFPHDRKKTYAKK